MSPHALSGPSYALLQQQHQHHQQSLQQAMYGQLLSSFQHNLSMQTHPQHAAYATYPHSLSVQHGISSNPPVHFIDPNEPNVSGAGLQENPEDGEFSLTYVKL